MEHASNPTRRDFVGKLATGAAALVGGAALTPLALERLSAEPAAGQPASGQAPDSPWDMSWVSRLEAPQYRVVFDARTVDDRAMNLAWDFFEQYHSVYGLPDGALRPVIVMRQLGAPLGFNDAIWARYRIGESSHQTDPATKEPALRNPFWKARAGATDYEIGMSLERLQQRGAIFLVCSHAAMNAAASMAERMHADADSVKREVRANLIPGALLMPDGIFALIRAQNAGCAYMGGV